MKKTFNYKFGNVLTSATLMLIVGFFSCTNSGSTTSTSDTDTGRTTGSTMSGTNDNADGQTNNMNNGTNDGSGTTGSSNSNSSNNSIDEDTTFIMKAAEINMEEIKLGKLAQQKGTSSHVKELARMMVTEHTQAMKNLAPLAKAKAFTLPTRESEKITDDYQKLSSKTGKDFDKAYSDMMVDGHKDAISLFEKTNNNTKDAEIKAMTTAMLPKLRTHLEHSEMCKKECEKM